MVTLEAINVKKLEIHPGTIYALVGPPGCGKTTLLELLSGSQKQSSGELYFENFPYETNWFGKIKSMMKFFIIMVLMNMVPGLPSAR